MIRVTLILAALTCSSHTARAAVGGGAGAGTVQSQTQSPEYGLCMNTPVNQDSPQIKNGLCQQMVEDLENEPCMKDKVDKLYLRAKTGELNGFKDWCPNSKAILANEDGFKQFLLNLQASVAYAESRFQNIPAKVINKRTGQRAMGICQLSVASVQGYQCGCKGRIKSQTDIMDAKKNMTCGLGISLTNMLKDEAVGHGKNGDKTSFGVAKYNEPGRESSNQREGTMDRVKNFCEVASTNVMALSPFKGQGDRTRFTEGPTTRSTN